MWLCHRLLAQSTRQHIEFTDYGICQPDTIEVPVALKEFPAGEPGQQPINAEADEMQSSGDDEVQFDGNVRIVQGGQGIFADRAVYNRKTDFLEAEGNVRVYTSDGDELKAETVELEVDTFSGTVHNAGMRFADSHPVFISRQHARFEEDYSLFAPFTNKVPAAHRAQDDVPVQDPVSHVRARATAASIELQGGDYQVMHDVVLTNCEEGNRSVELAAKRIQLDHVRGTGTGKSMMVRFKKVPILYFPILSFPIDDRRKTGFLFPGYGYDQKSGLTLELPYYINIAPRYDATVTPRILKNRGIQLYGEFRYLTENSRGNIRGEFLPSDDVYGGQERYAVQHRSRNPAWRKLGSGP